MRALLVQGGVGGEGAETPALAELLRLLPTFAQMTCDDEASWSEDADAFVSEDDEENLNVTLRTAAMDLTAQLLDTYPRPALRTCNALVSELAAAQPHSGWKVIEAFLMLLGAAHNEIEELLDCDANASILSLSRVFEVLVLPHLDSDATFLRGRCLSFPRSLSRPCRATWRGGCLLRRSKSRSKMRRFHCSFRRCVRFAST